MPWTQYSRNLEDVMLRRALGAIAEGSFIDVGAGHPVYDSNTYAFYLSGWRGIALEPIEETAQLWRQERPEDLVIVMAAAAARGETTLHLMPEAAQISTLDAGNAAEWQRVGYKVLERRVPCTTLNEVLERLQEGELHLMSVDVEGAEAEALAGLDLARHRPWIIVVEAIWPGSGEQSHAAWEPGVLAAGYEFTHFDSCNRFYVAAEHGDLKKHFLLPPGPQDDYVRGPRIEEILPAANAPVRR